MKTADLVLATNDETDRAFDTGTFAAVLATLGGVVLSYHFSVLSFTEAVAWTALGVPGVALVSSILLARWLGYTDEARYRSFQYSMQLNDRWNDRWDD